MADLPATEESTENLAELIDEEVPLADVPKTGDNLVSYLIATLISGFGLAYLTLAGKKRKENA